jgi:RNA polymerase sigma-70 factor (ECF subfamily)
MRPADPPVDDLELKRRILAGDRGATEAFVEDHVDALYEFVHYRAGGDRATAEDVVQDTLLTGLRSLAGYDGRATLYTWLCGIAKNKIRAERRKRRPVPLADVLDEADAEIHAILARVASEPLPDWVLERQETAELVGATLSSLPPDYRRALVEKYVEGISVAEMARRAGKGEKAAESTLHRARVAFAKVFETVTRRSGGLS